MSHSIIVPKKNKNNPFSVYVYGKVDENYFDDEIGSLFVCSGVGIVFYSYSNYRRGYFFCEKDANTYNLPCMYGKIPFVQNEVAVFATIDRRKIDLVKFMLYNLRKKYTDEIYLFNPIYWVTLISSIDMALYNKKISLKRVSFMLTERYIAQRERWKND